MIDTRRAASDRPLPCEVGVGHRTVGRRRPAGGHRWPASPTAPRRWRCWMPAGRTSSCGRARPSHPRWHPASSPGPSRSRFPTSGGRHRLRVLLSPAETRSARPLAGERPPLLLLVHGGPTAASAAALQPGGPVLDHAGIRGVRPQLPGQHRVRAAPTGIACKGNWGIYDVDDCLAAARALIAAGRVDPRAWRSGAAAPAATPCWPRWCAATVPRRRQPVRDQRLVALARDTHKFESRYCESLVGPSPARPTCTPALAA